MESGSLRANSELSSSLRENSSRIWRSMDTEVFRRSSRDEDDEEALKWANLEKLPTFDRLRRGLLVGSQGAQEVDVHDLGYEDKKKLVERLVNNVEHDNEKFLLKLRSRIDRVGIDIPTIEVRYEHLNIDAEAYKASRALPSFVNFHINIVEGILNFLRILPSTKKPFTILTGVSGIIKPCRMTLLLGPPSSGKTTLLLALAGRLDSDRFISVQEFAEAFQSSVVGRRLRDELAVPYDKSKNHPAALLTKKYGLGRKEIIRACAERELLLMKRNSFVYLFKLFQASIRWIVNIPITFIEVGTWTGLTYYVIGLDPVAHMCLPISNSIIQIHCISRQEHGCSIHIWLVLTDHAFRIRWLCPEEDEDAVKGGSIIKVIDQVGRRTSSTRTEGTR